LLAPAHALPLSRPPCFPTPAHARTHTARAGLLHTHEAGCTPPGDGVTDTPANLDAETGWQPAWLYQLSEWCKRFRRGENPDPKALLQYQSCPNRGGKDVVDNVFNLMSYLDDVCRMHFTENQVRVAAPRSRQRRRAAG
jgi:hypothetical protein